MEAAKAQNWALEPQGKNGLEIMCIILSFKWHVNFLNEIILNVV
jgi:hypothetical protein